MVSILTSLITLIPFVVGVESSSSSSSSSRSSSHSSTSQDNLSPFPTLKMGSEDNYTYYTNVSFGTPGQNIGLRIDMTQPYIWVRTEESLPRCRDNQTSYWYDQCETLGTFESNESSTFYDFNDWQRLVTLDYVNINGSVVEDDLKFNDVANDNDILKNYTFENVDFINANDSGTVVGALGLAGPIEGELDNYNSIHFLDVLKDENIINSSSYSLYHHNNSYGELILGGINQDYYTGDLVYFHNIPYLDRDSGTTTLHHNYPIVPLSSLSVSNRYGTTAYLSTNNDTVPMLIDTRATYSYIPYSLVVALAVQLNAFYSDDEDSWFVKCSIGDLNATIGFQIGNVTIDVPVSDVIEPAKVDSGNGTLVFDDGEEACFLLFTPDYYFGYSVLGSPFYKNAYIVVDNEANQIALAQAAKPTTQRSLPNSSTTDYQASAISSGYIPFATTNNITQTYTYVFDQTSIKSSVQPNLVTVSITNGEIYTGRVQSSNSSTHASSTVSGMGVGQFNNINGNGSLLWGISFISIVLGLGLLF